MKTNKGFAPVAVIIFIIAILAVGGVVYYSSKKACFDIAFVPGPNCLQAARDFEQKHPGCDYSHMCTDNSNVSTSNVKLDPSNDYLKKYNALFTQEFKQPENLTPGFRLVAVNCGSECFYLFALEKNTGKIFNLADYQWDKNVSFFKNYKILEDNSAVYGTLSNGDKLFFYHNSLASFESSNTLPD